MTFYELYEAICAKLPTGELDLVPGILKDGNVAAFYEKITIGKSLVLSNPSVEPPSGGPSIQTFTLTGTTMSLGSADGSALTASIIFTEQLGAIYSVGDYRTDLQWNLPGIQWFGIANPGVTVSAGDGTLPAYGILGGHPSCLKDVFIGIQLPLPGNTWVLNGTFAKPAGLADVIQLAGGINLANSIPAPLNLVTSIGVSSTSLAYNTASATLESLAFTVVQNDPEELFTLFPFLPGFPQVGRLVLNVVVIDPVKVRKTAFSFSGIVVFPSSDSSSTAAPTMSLSGSLPDFKIRGTLDDRGAMLTVDDILHIILPASITTGIKGGFQTLSFSADTLTNNYTLSGTFNADWGITIATPLFTIPLVIKQLSMSLERAGKRNGGSFGGVIQIGRDDDPDKFQLSLMAGTPIDSEEWSYRGWLSEGSISLSALLNTFTNGVFKIPAESFNLVIKQLDVQISSGGSYQFEVGAVMTLPFGIGQVSGSLGVYSDGELPASLDMLHSPGVLQRSRFLALPSPASDIFDRTDDKPLPAYRLTASYTLLNIDWVLTVDMKNKDDYRYFLSLSDYLTGEYKTDPASKETTVTIKFGDVSVGDIVALMLSWASAGGPRSLSAPWDLLNSIPLNNLQIVVNVTKGTIGVDYPADGNLGLNFGIFTLNGIKFTYQPKTGSTKKYAVMVELDGEFITGDAIPSWDATDPDSAPVPSGSGNKYLDIRLLALGQHVTVAGYDSFTSVEDAIDAMRSLAPPTDDNTIPVSADPVKGQPQFDPKSSWLIGMNFGVLRFGGDDARNAKRRAGGVDMVSATADKAGYLLDLSIIFNDPNLYALRFALDGPVAKTLAGLAFEIMYKKVSDSIGMYQAKLTLPNAVRQLQFGVAGVTLPNFGVQVYTNGDFLVDIGFPYNNDFSVSFSVQIQAGPIPLIGSGGVYFGKLSSATTSIVPTTTSGSFNPVITLGVGIQVGLGKDINIGIMQAGFSLTVFGVIEGIYAAYNPFDERRGASDFFSIKGTLGVIGRLYGTVNFAIISADFDIVVKIYVQASYQSYGAMPITIAASVDIRLTVKINLGIFSIKIRLSFSASVKETLVIGSDDSARAPWNQPSSGNKALLVKRRNLHALRAAYVPRTRKRLVMTTLKHATAADKLPLTLYFGPAQTVANKSTTGALTDQKSRIVNLLYIDTANASFDNLCLELFHWLVTSYRTGKLTRENIAGAVISYTDLLDIYHELTDSQVATPLSVHQIDEFLNDQLAVTIVAADPTENTEKSAAVFPMPPEITLTVPGGKQRTLSTFTSCTDQYLVTMNAYFRDLQMQVESDLTARNAAALRMDIEPDQGLTVSAAGLVFQDFFVMMSSQLIQYGLDAMTHYKYQLNAANPNSLAGIVGWSDAMRPASGADKNDLTCDAIAEANKDAPLTGGTRISITGRTTQIVSATTLASVVDLYGSGITVEQLIAVNGATPYLINGNVVIANSAGATITTESDSTFASLQRAAQWPAAEFAAATATLQGLLTDRTMMRLPDLVHVTAGDHTDTLGLVANRYATTPSQIAATPANQILSPLFHTTPDTPAYLDLPHMPYLTVAAITEEIKNCNSLQQLSGMVSRFLVYGMRLPIGANNGLTFNDPDDTPCTGNDCSMYSVTGQQFDLPVLAPTDIAAVTMTATASAPAWIRFAGDAGATVTFSAAMIGIQNAVLAEAQTVGVQPQIDYLGIAPMREEQALQYDFAHTIAWQADGAISLPYGAPDPNEKAPVPYIWPFSKSVLSYLPKTAFGLPHPKVGLKIGSIDPATGQRLQSDCSYYAWGSLVNFTIKKIAGGGNAFTYELTGADEAGVMILERLLAVSSATGTPVQDMTLLYAPNASSRNDAGMVSDAPTAMSAFITQANLSTYTNPAGSELLRASPETLQPQGFLNTSYDFIKLLWECSITRSGGFYLYYQNKPKQRGFPDLIFNEHGEATLGLLITYAACAAGIESDWLYDYMNVAVTGQNIDPASQSLFGVAQSIPVNVAIGDQATLDGIAAGLNLPVGEAAQLLGDVALAASATVKLSGLIYQAGSLAPGVDPQDIANYYLVSLAQLTAQNQGRGIDFTQPIPVWTALRIPALDYPVSSGTAGTTLNAIAAYFGAAMPKLASDNRSVAGLLQPSTQAIDVLFNNIHTTTPAGCLALKASRPNPGPLPPPGTPAYAQIYLQQTYNLLSYRFGGNRLHNDAFPDTNWGIPVGPLSDADDADVAEKIRAVPEDDDSAGWEYAKTVPAYRVLNGPAIAESGALPPVAGDPYSVINKIAQIEFVWRDLYGNETITPVSDPTLYPNGPKNAPPALLGYTDDLLPLSAWPSMRPQYRFDSVSGVPSLVAVLHFDTSLYTDDPKHPDKPWQEQARKDLETYKTVYYQICQPALAGQAQFAVNFSLLTSLLASTPGNLGNADAATLQQAVKDIYLYLQARAAGSAWLPPAAGACRDIGNGLGGGPDAWNCWCIAEPIALSEQNSAELFELTVDFVISRNSTYVAAAFADDQAVSQAVTPLDPYVAAQMDHAPAGATPQTYALDAFARDFETIFTVPGSHVWKLASGYDRYSSAAPASGSRKPLWVARMGLSRAAGIYVGKAGDPVFFAPTPLATALQSETVDIHPWDASSGAIDPGKSSTSTFQNIDMDVWMNSFFSAADHLLSPDLISQAFLVDYLTGASLLPDILQAKENLAAAYAKSRTAPILSAQQGSDPASAAERLKQQMLIRLADAYKVTTIVSYPMEVTAEFTGEDATVAPRMYGTPVIARKDAGAGDNAGQNYSFSSAKVSLDGRTRKSDLTFLFYAKNPGDSAVADVNLDYVATHLEHAIGAVPGIADYDASSWLSFVLPPDPAKETGDGPLFKMLGRASIPVPLRAYPGAPSMTTQGQLQDLSADPTLADVLRWNYCYTYVGSAARQDTLHTIVRVNIDDGKPTMLAVNNSKKLFEVLAQYASVQQDLSASFTTCLKNVTLQMSGSDQIVQRAKGGLQSMLSLLSDAASYLPQWVPTSRGMTEPGNYYIVTQGADEEHPDRFIVTIEPDGARPVPYPDLPLPEMHLDKYDTVAAGKKNSYWFTSKENKKVYLRPAEGEAMSNRQLRVNHLNVLTYQNAWAAAYVKRNEFFGDKAAADNFIYTSQLAKPANLWVPLIDYAGAIGIANPQRKTPAPSRRQLAATLTAFFTDLYAAADGKEQLITIEGTYSYPLMKGRSAAEQIVVTQPMLLKTHAPSATTKEGIAAFCAALAKAVTIWFVDQKPNYDPDNDGGRDGGFGFDISVFSTIGSGGNRMPLLRLRNLALPLGDLDSVPSGSSI